MAGTGEEIAAAGAGPAGKKGSLNNTGLRTMRPVRATRKEAYARSWTPIAEEAPEGTTAQGKTAGEDGKAA